MDSRLLDYYNRELGHLRELGGEFAKEFPKVARRLALDEFECIDPYVERLLEGLAFLAARVQLKIDAEFPRFAQNLIDIVYPHYLAPTPSMLVAQIDPQVNVGAMLNGVVVPRESELLTRVGAGEQRTRCKYRTGHDVTLWPLEVVDASYSAFTSDLDIGRSFGQARVAATIRIRLAMPEGTEVRALALDKLPVYLGHSALGAQLQQLILAHGVGLVVRSEDGTPESITRLGRDAIRSFGYEDDQSLLPYTKRSFHGYRLLHEYFAFPSRFCFVEFADLASGLRRIKSRAVELIVLLNRADPTFEGRVSASHFALHCVPAVNIFRRRGAVIRLSDEESEYHVVPDRNRPLDIEVFHVTRVEGQPARDSKRIRFLPLYAATDATAANSDGAYYVVNRLPRGLVAGQARRSARSRYVGSEAFLSLVDGQHGAFRSSLREVKLDLLCTNRDLPLHLSLGHATGDFDLESDAPVNTIRCLGTHTAPRASAANGDLTWRLIRHLSLNYGSLAGGEQNSAEPLRELMRLYADLGEPALKTQIDGIQQVSTAPISRRVPGLRYGAARGLEVTLVYDGQYFQGASAFLLGSVLARFFQRYVSLNSICETVLKTLDHREVMRWPASVGTRPIL